MTSHDYTVLAKAIYKAGCATTTSDDLSALSRAVDIITLALADEYDNFNKKKFVRACGFGPSSIWTTP